MRDLIDTRVKDRMRRARQQRLQRVHAAARQRRLTCSNPPQHLLGRIAQRVRREEPRSVIIQHSLVRISSELKVLKVRRPRDELYHGGAQRIGGAQ